MNFNKILGKYDAYKVESGKDGLSNRILKFGKEILVVGKNGVSYKREQWNKSRTFWQDNQDNLLVADNQTRVYQNGTPEKRAFLSKSAWGTVVNIRNYDDINHPKVSVCIPVRNGGNFIHEALDSVLNQTYTNFEIIVIDNASTDDTVKWLEKLSANNTKIRFFKNDSNIGLIENFNACLNKSTGEYVKFLCADDILMPDCLERMVSALDANLSVTLVTVGRLLINQKNEVLAHKTYSKKESKIRGLDAINRCLFGSNYIGEPSATMFRRQVLINGFDKNLPHLVDLEMWFRLMEQGDLFCIPKPLCAIRRHDLQMTQRNIQSGVLVEDNVILYDLYKDKPYVEHTWISKFERKIRMAYRVWMCRQYIETKRKAEILKLQSSATFYYTLIPLFSFAINIIRKLNCQLTSRFSAKAVK